jgi:hypothetical protein
MLEMICSLISQGGLVKCPSNYECLLLAENPGEGNINFDSIGGAMVTIFVVMTMEGWAEVMYWVQVRMRACDFVGVGGLGFGIGSCDMFWARL